ncbi:MAG TPA: RNA-binding domain-containing protein [Thermomicrobiales bacterium]|nr:RNA-binding domain-containing protein [Thermomicrobiales bacterium]
MPAASPASAPASLSPATQPTPNGHRERHLAERAAPATASSALSWRKIDLHLHTSRSSDYQQPSVTPLDILQRAEERGLDIIAFTDHNSVRGYADMWREIEDLELLEYLKRIEPAEEERLREYRRLLAKMLVLPGFEFTAQFGFHILAIFPEGTSVRLMEHLLLALGVPEERFGSGEVGATSDVLRAYEILADHGAMVIGAHVNSTHGIAMQGLRFGGQTKIAYTQDPHLLALEVTDLALGPHRRSTARFFNGSKPEYPRRMHCIQGSDAHRLDRDPERESSLGVGDRATEALLPDVSFQALKALFQSDAWEATRPHVAEPDDPVKAARLNGPGRGVAFHESIASRRSGSGLSLALRDFAAMANTDGGVLYIGAGASEKRAVAGVADPEATAAELRHEIAAQIAPALPVEIETVDSSGKAVLLVTAPKGAEPPYTLGGTIFVRRDAESTPATRDEIVALVRGVAAPASSASKVVAAPPANAPRRQPPAVRNDATANGRPPAAASKTEHAAAPASAPAPAPNASLEPFEEPVAPDPVAPTTGIEIVESFEQDGVAYFTLRDLRYHKLIGNVTRDTDRRLWRSAIAQQEEGDIDPAKIRWVGDHGLARSYRLRGGDRRFNLVYRGDGYRTFYGVSEAGMTGDWQALREKTASAVAANGAGGGGRR